MLDECGLEPILSAGKLTGERRDTRFRSIKITARDEAFREKSAQAGALSVGLVELRAPHFDVGLEHRKRGRISDRG